MTEDPRDEDYLDLFKPKPESAAGSAGEVPGPDAVEPVSEVESLSEGATWDSPPADQHPPSPGKGGGVPASGQTEDVVYETAKAADDNWFTQPVTDSGESPPTLQTLGVAVGAGCLLLMLTAVVVFAFVQVFLRGGRDTGVPHTPTPTVFVAATPSPTPIVAAEFPVVQPLVSSTDVQVPVTLPKRLIIADAVFTVRGVDAATGAWPAAPAIGDLTNWAVGTVVNYVFSLAPTPENRALVSELERGDSLSLDMSTGVVLHFNVSDVTTGADDEATYFAQTSPRLTLAVQAASPAQRIVLTAAYFDAELQVAGEVTGAAIGLVGTPVIQGPVRVTVLETYQVTGEAAGLPRGTGYLLMDVTVENIGTDVLQPQYFQTFVSGSASERFPLTFSAEQYARYGFPTEPLAPGETVIGSYGYLVTADLEGEFRWVFNPQPASEYWLVVPVSYQAPPILPTAEPTPVEGFVVVTVQTNDVFVNRDDGLLDVVLRIQNTAAGAVSVTQEDISLSSWTDGELALVAPAPPLPWTIEAGELKLFQLQFQLPTTDSALLSVKGYSFSIENLGGE